MTVHNQLLVLLNYQNEEVPYNVLSYAVSRSRIRSEVKMFWLEPNLWIGSGSDCYKSK